MTPGMTPMTKDQARELFSEAFDGLLEVETRRDFEALLEHDAELRAEYEVFKSALGLMRTRPRPPAPNLLPGVQRKLRMRGRGRYYGGRFLERLGLGVIHPIALGFLMLALLGVGYLLLRWLDVGGGQ